MKRWIVTIQLGKACKFLLTVLAFLCFQFDKEGEYYEIIV